MLWVLLYSVIAALAVLVLAMVGLRLWRRVKALTRELGKVTALADQATATLERLQPAARH